MKKIYIASDHAGYNLKNSIISNISRVQKIIDLGPDSKISVDYPDFAHHLAESIENNENELGIQFCGTGNGINMSANKHQEIRAALCWNSNIAEQARLHNNANVLTMPARHLKWEEVEVIVSSFLETNFDPVLFPLHATQTNAIIKKLYDTWSFNFMPSIGKQITGDKEAYTYLVESIRQFPTQPELAQMFSDAGFSRVKYRNLSNGIVALHSGWKI